MKLNCVITDDEPVAIEILQDYISMVPGLQLVATCKDAIETMAVLKEQQVDILFLDIQMPEITGMELMRSLPAPPAVIFTTAYTHYAHEGFDLDAVDYLLKPISVERFLKAVNKIETRLTGQYRPADSRLAGQNYFFVKVDQEFIKLEFSRIMFIEGLENYVKIHCKDKTLVSFSTMKNMEELLAQHRFLRIHRSFIINLDNVDTIQNYTFMVNGKPIVAGKSYHKSIAQQLRKQFSV